MFLGQIRVHHVSDSSEGVFLWICYHGPEYLASPNLALI